MRRLVCFFLMLLLMIATASYAVTNGVILNLPEMTEDGTISFDKMSNEELLIFKELLEAEIEFRAIEISNPTQTHIIPETQSPTMGERNALGSAYNYLNFMNFSYSGLINQLLYEGYTQEQAEYAANNCGADWFEQAYGTAQNYLNFMSFSRKGLIDQLLYEGYTQEQAEYAVKKVGY